MHVERVGRDDLPPQENQSAQRPRWSPEASEPQFRVDVIEAAQRVLSPEELPERRIIDDSDLFVEGPSAEEDWKVVPKGHTLISGRWQRRLEKACVERTRRLSGEKQALSSAHIRSTGRQ